jgi:penicillin-insensitive murein endopeptidase
MQIMDRALRRAIAAVFIGVLTQCAAHAAASQCYGTVAQGRLSGGVQLPEHGANFLAYSHAGVVLGRTHVHVTVRDIVVDAYDKTVPGATGVVFEYGETGWASGGRFPPHRSHQAGVSVDFMVPVRDAAGKSVPLPANATNKFGYAWEFDERGRAGSYRIDFEAMGEHLYQLSLAAKRRGVDLQRVIFDPRLTELLLKTRRGSELASILPLMKQRPWIRHDEHYHVDFALPCKPLAQFKQE